MSRHPFALRTLPAAVAVAALLAACGGGTQGSGGSAGPLGNGSDGPTQIVDNTGSGQTDTSGGAGNGAPSSGETPTQGNTGQADTDQGETDPGSDAGNPGGANPPVGGGGGDEDDGATPTQPGMPTMMACADAAPAGRVVQCSGGRILRHDHGVGTTRSGVQVWAKSTRDEAVIAYGLAPAGFVDGMTAELRITRDLASGRATEPALMLDKLDLSWDGLRERPPIIDTFHSAGEARVVLDANDRLQRLALPASSDLAFYDYALRGTAGTQAHYANNVYFPRSPDNPARCPPHIDPASSQCQAESLGLQNGPGGDWRSGGVEPDRANAVRFHEDGDIHAGDAASGNPPILDGGSGLGAPFPGSKGYRTLNHLGYRYVNLASWFSQDTVGIVEWTGGPGANEHNKNRRGIVTFGEVTDPATVPVTGTVTYAGVAQVWRSEAADADPAHQGSAASVTVNLATREAVITLPGVRPGGLSFSIRGDGPTAEWRNLLTGAANGPGSLVGGASARYFGPVVPGAAGAGPAEIGGAFTFSDAVTGETLIGGFAAVKRPAS